MIRQGVRIGRNAVRIIPKRCPDVTGNSVRMLPKYALENDSKITFVDSKWSSIIPEDKFLIFDKYFIDKYVHSLGPDSTDTSQRRQERGKTIIYLGNFSEYNKEIDKVNKLKSAILEKNKFYSILGLAY